MLAHTKCTVQEPTPKKLKTNTADDTIPGPVSDVNTATTPAVVFQPLHALSEWTEPGTTTKCVTVAVVLPSGIEPGKFSVRVMEGGTELHVTVVWPNPLADVHTMHRKWLHSDGPDKLEVYHPRFVGFDNFLKSLRARSTDNIESTAKIPMPFPVQTHIYGKYNMGWRESSTRMVYVELRGFEENYGAHNDDSSFEIS